MSGMHNFVKRPISQAVQAAIYTMMLTTSVQAAPTGGQVVGGSGAISQSGLNTTVNQASQNMAINWQSYNVNSNERVQYIQPNSSSISLNRILSNNGSTIAGRIDANGQVILVNPNGIFFTPTAVVNVGGIIASGLDIKPDDFMNGNYIFNDVLGKDGTVINTGTINASLGGNVALIGRQVKNDGLIAANLGTVSLAAGKQAVLTFDNGGLLGVRVSKAILQDEIGVDPAVINNGTIQASGGRVLLTASTSQDVFSQAVNTNGIQQATSVVVNADGTFTLGAGADAINTGTIDTSTTSADQNVGRITMLGNNVTSSGTLKADAIDGDGGEIELHSTDTTLLTDNSMTSARSAANGNGGIVKVLGDKVGLFDQSTVDVAGANGGGQALIGGDKQGNNPSISDANFIYLSEQSQVTADALDKGDGGKIISFASNTARIYGALSAQGGVNGGNGGYIETSGLIGFDIANAPNAGASNGLVGVWVVDPFNLTIGNSGNTNVTASTPFQPTDTGATLDRDTIRSALITSDVTITTVCAAGGAGAACRANTDAGDITFTSSADINYNSRGVRTLTVDAAGSILFQAGSSIYDSSPSSGDQLSVVLTAGGSVTLEAASGALNPATILTQGGSFTVGSIANPVTGFTNNGVIDTTGSFNNDGGDIAIYSSGIVSSDGFTAKGGNTGTSSNNATDRPGRLGGNLTINGSSVAITGAIDTSGSAGTYDTNGAGDNGQDGGNGGYVHITASTGDANLMSVTTNGGDAAGDYVGATDTGNGGDAGEITIASGTAGKIILNDNLTAQGAIGYIDTSTNKGSNGSGNNVTLNGLVELATNIDINSAGAIDSQAHTPGAYGNIVFNGALSGASNGVDALSVVGNDITFSGEVGNTSNRIGAINLYATGIVNAGSYSITATTLQVNAITTPALSFTSGNIDTTSATTDGGSIEINAGDITVGGIDSSSATGIGGAITLNAVDDTNNGTPTITLNGDIKNASGATAGNAYLTLNGQSSPQGAVTIKYASDFSSTINVTGSAGTDSLAEANRNNTWSLADTQTSSSAISSINNSNILFSDIETLIGNDSVDTFQLPNTGAFVGSVDGGNGTDIVQGGTQDTNWNITGANSGTVTGLNNGASDSFLNIETLKGNSGVDTLYLTASAIFNGIFDGGAGTGDMIVGGNQNTQWTVAGANTVNVTGMTTLAGGAAINVEKLQGNNNSNIDTFYLNDTVDFAGSINGGGGSSNVIVGGNLHTYWNVSAGNTGTVTTDASGANFTDFSNIQILTGKADIDEFKVGAGAGVVEIDGGGGANTFTINGTVNTLNANGVVGDTSTVLNTVAVNGGGSVANTITGGYGDNVIAIGDTSGSDGSAGSIDVSQGTGSTITVYGKITTTNGGKVSGAITGGSGIDSITVDGYVGSIDARNGGDNPITVNDGGQVVGAIQTGSGIDHINFIGTGTAGSVSTGDGGDFVNIVNENSVLGLIDAGGASTDSDTLTASGAGVTIDLGAKAVNFEIVNATGTGTNILVGGSSAINIWDVGATGDFVNDGTTNTQFSGFTELHAGNNGDTFNITTAGITKILGSNAGNDTFILDTAGLVASIYGGTQAGDNDTLSVTNGPNTWVMSATAGTGSVTNNTTSAVTQFSSIEATQASGGGADSIDLSALTGPLTIKLTDYQGYGLIIGNNQMTLQGMDTPNTWLIGKLPGNTDTRNDGVDDGQVNSTNFIDFPNLLGGNQSDSFIVEASSAVTTTLTGPGTINSIDGGAAGGTNSLTARDGTNTWLFTAADSGSLEDSANAVYVTSFSRIQQFVAGSTADIADVSGIASTDFYVGNYLGFGNIKGSASQNLIGDAGWDSTWTIDAANNGGSVTIAQGATSHSIGFSDFGYLTGSDATAGTSGTSVNNQFTIVSSGAYNSTIRGGNNAGSHTATNILTGFTGSQWSINDIDGGTIDSLTFRNVQNLVSGGSNTFNLDIGGSLSGHIEGDSTDTLKVNVDGSNVQLMNATTDTPVTGRLNVFGVATIDATNAANTTLFGANVDNTWDIQGSGSGTVAGINFKNFTNLQGNTQRDDFTLEINGAVSGLLDGGTDAAATTQPEDTLTVVAGRTSGVSIQLGTTAGSTSPTLTVDHLETITADSAFSASNQLLGANNAAATNTWHITGADIGTVDDTATTTTFTNFGNLSGGSGKDDFTLDAGGALSGLLDGGTNALVATQPVDTLTIAAGRTSGVSIQLGTPAGSTSPTLMVDHVERVTADSAFSASNQLLGANSATTTNTWHITGSNRGRVDDTATTTNFFNFGNLSGGSGKDDFTLDVGGILSGLLDGGTQTGATTQPNDTLTVAAGRSSGVSIQLGTTAGSVAPTITVDHLETVTADSAFSANNQLLGVNSATATNTWHINGSDTGTVADGTTTTNFTYFGNLTGGSGKDDFTLDAGGALSGLLAGGTDAVATTQPVDTLTIASSYGSAVNIQLGSIVKPSATLTIDQIETVTADSAFSASNQLLGANSATATNTWDITGSDRGQVNDTVTTTSFVNFGNLTGGSGVDQFTLKANGALSGLLDGGVQVGATTQPVDTLTVDSSYGKALSIQLGSTVNSSATLSTNNLEQISADSTYSASNQLFGANSATNTNTWTINGNDGGQVDDTVTTTTFSNIGNLVGGSGRDNFSLATGGMLSGYISGDAADTLSVNAPYATVQLMSAITSPLTPGYLNVYGIKTMDGAGSATAGFPSTATLVGDNSENNYWYITGTNSGRVYLGPVASTTPINFTAFANLTSGKTASNTGDSFYVQNNLASGGTDNGQLTGLINGQGVASLFIQSSTANPYDILVETSDPGQLNNSNYTISVYQVPDLNGGNIISDGPNVWDITGTNQGTLNGTISFNSADLHGRNYDDTFIWEQGGSITGVVDGGGGENSLVINASGDKNIILGGTGGSTSTMSVTNIQNIVANNGANNTLTEANSAAAVTTWSISPESINVYSYNTPFNGTLNSGAVNDGTSNAAINNGDIRFTGFTNLVANQSNPTGQNVFTLAQDGGLSGYIVGAGANDIFNINSTSPLSVELLAAAPGTALSNAAGTIALYNVGQVNGNDSDGVTANDTLVGMVHTGNNAPTDTWSIDRLNGGQVTDGPGGTQSVIFTQFGNLQGNPGNDSFALSQGGGFSGVIHANGGTDTLSVGLTGNEVGQVNFLADNGATATVLLQDGSSVAAGYSGTFNTAVAIGGTNYDQIQYTNAGHTYTVNYANAATVDDSVMAGSFTITGPVTGNNMISLANTTATSTLNGQNTLSFQVNSATPVNLANKTAVQVAGTGTDAIALQDNLTLPAMTLDLTAQQLTQTANTTLLADGLLLNGFAGIGASGAGLISDINHLSVSGNTGPIYIDQQGLHDLDLAGLNTTNLLDITAADNITSTADLISSGELHLTTAGDISLTGTNNSLAGPLTLSEGNTDSTLNNSTFTINNTVDTLLGDISVKDLTMTSTGNISNINASTIVSTGQTTLASDGNINLASATNDFNTISVTNASNVTLDDLNDIGLVSLANSNTAANIARVTITSGGKIRDANNGNMNIVADSIELNAVNGIGDGSVGYDSATHSIPFDDAGAIHTQTSVLSAINLNPATNAGVGAININNNAPVTINDLRNNGDIILNNNSYNILLAVNGGTGNSQNASQNSQTTSYGAIDANYHGNISDPVYAGSVAILGTGAESVYTLGQGVTEADITAEDLLVYTANEFGDRRIPQPIRLRINRQFSLFSVDGAVTYPNGMPANPVSTTADLVTIEGVTGLSGQQMIDIGSLGDVDPAIFTEVRNYNHEDVAILLPPDQRLSADDEDCDDNDKKCKNKHVAN